MLFISAREHPELNQRRMVFINTFLSMVMMGVAFLDIVYNNYIINIYESSVRNVVLFFAPAFLLGTSIGKALIRSSRRAFIFRTIEVLSATVFATMLSLEKLSENLFSTVLYRDSLYSIKIAVGCVLVLFLAIKLSYMLRIVTIDYVDGKQGIIPWMVLLLSGFTIGLIGAGTCIISSKEMFFLSLISLPVLIVSFFMYGILPVAEVLAKDDDESEEETSVAVRDDVYVSYLNFSFILLYLFLGYLAIVSLYGNDVRLQIAFLILVLVSIGAGITIGNKMKNAFWLYFSEMLFPVAMIFYILAINIQWEINFPIHKALFFSVPSIIFGFSIGKSVEIIFRTYNIDKRFTILHISLFIMPVPIIIALAIVDFSKLLFYLFLYGVMVINILLPGIYLLKQNIHYYKKMLYLIFCLVFIPMIIVLHKNLNAPLDNSLLINHVKNFNLLYNNKYNSLYINNSKNIEYHRRVIFENNDNAIRNMQRIIIPLYLYAKEDNSAVLIINGNHKFYKNPMLNFFEQLSVIDYVPERKVDYNSLPLGGAVKYFVEKGEIAKILKQKKDAMYDIIVDYPNLLDQQLYDWKTSDEFYTLIKSKIKKGGIFAQILNTDYVKSSNMISAKKNIEKIFMNMNTFVMADLVMFIASENPERIKINTKNYNSLIELFNKNENMIYFYYNPNHLVWHFAEPKALKIIESETDWKDFEIFGTREKKEKYRILSDDYEVDVNILIASEKDSIALKTALTTQYRYDKDLFMMLRKAEIAEEEQDYLKEAEIIDAISKKYYYRSDVAKYLEKIIKFKEEFYLTLAIEMEKEKNWEEAKKVYYAILKIKNDAFEPNYRLGLLNITVQNIEEALKYMNNALKMKNDDPRVQYQMGVLMFSNGKQADALKYFEKSLQLKNETPTLYLYMGMCNEAMGKIYEAKEYYKKAAFLDPNDNNIKTSMERINEKIQKEIDKWKTNDPKNQNEDEQGENVPLPVNKSAYEYRITDQEAQKMKDKNN